MQVNADALRVGVGEFERNPILFELYGIGKMWIG